MSLTNENEMNEVMPVLPVAGFVGGKRLLSKTIIKRISTIKHEIYAEPFVGMGGVFFRRKQKPKAEKINDYNGEITNLFRILREHSPQFIEMLRFQLCSRRDFDRLKNLNPEHLTDLQRAARFLYLLKAGFGGHPIHFSFGVTKARPSRFDMVKLMPMLQDVADRLSGVTIENLSFEKFIPKFDTDATLFYIDPPYYFGENDYGKDMFKRSDFELLNDILKSIKGRFLLSLNDVPQVREIFKRFEFQEVSLNYSLAVKVGTKTNELIISN